MNWKFKPLSAEFSAAWAESSKDDQVWTIISPERVVYRSDTPTELHRESSRCDELWDADLPENAWVAISPVGSFFVGVSRGVVCAACELEMAQLLDA